MKKYLIATILVLSMLPGGTWAAEIPAAEAVPYVIPEGMILYTVTPKGSTYLDSYSVGILCNGGYEMEIVFNVFGTRTMDKIGAEKLVIQEWSGSKWIDYMTVKGSNHADFYAYDNPNCGGSYTFTGFPEAQYRVVLTAYAERAGGSDTGTVYSPTANCVY